MTFRFEFMKCCSSNLSEKSLEKGKRQCEVKRQSVVRTGVVGGGNK